jgi:hypothetical protein
MNVNIVTLRFLKVCVSCLIPFSYAHAGAFNTNCSYSHTLPDDSIVHYGKAGEAMVHDFFGNTKTDAFSTFDTLMQNKLSSCNNAPDFSAYWVPQLKRASGIVKPESMKIYYRNDELAFPVQPIPEGLQILAGSHMSTQPKPEITYNCSGKGPSTKLWDSCSLLNDASGSYAHLEIAIRFPNCWDGKNLKPDLSKRIANMAYSTSNGSCPADYPVKVPKLEMHIHYGLGLDTDLTTAQLSMDPKLENGVSIPQWGSLYTEHADFVSGWKVDSMQYAVDKCLNTDVGCENQIPLYFSKDVADGWISANRVTTTSGPILQIGPGDTAFIKFPTPTNTSEFPWKSISMQTYGFNVTDATQAWLTVYGATPRWESGGPEPQASDCSPVSFGGFGINNLQKPRLVNVTGHVKAAMSAGNPMVGICLRNTSGKTVELSSKDGKFAPVLFFQ